METTKTKKMSLLLSVLGLATVTASWMLPDGSFQAAMENELIKNIRNKLTAYAEHLPEDRVYLQLDKPLYEPGDDIWVSAFVRDGATLKPSTKSDIVYVELISPKGTVDKKINIIAKNGKAAGDFSIDKEAPGGLYKVRAYTNWMKNEGTENYFEKEIQVQDVILPNLKMKLDFEKKAFGAGDEVIAKLELNTNENKPLTGYSVSVAASLNGEKLLDKNDVTDEEGLTFIRFNLPRKLLTSDGLLNVMINYNGNTESISRSIPIVLNTLKFDMFPEGGDMVCGMENNVAFRALNEFGKPADIEGVVLNEKGNRVVAFSSFHFGMGAFHLSPKVGEKYSVKITKPEGIQETFLLPDAWEKGYVMSLNNSQNGEIGVSVNSTENEQMSLVAQLRGKMYYSTVMDVVPGSNKIVFPTKDFPIGVAQVTLFDSKGIARAERLVFVNKHKQLNVSVQTEKQKYLPREKVKMTITVKDERGLPMPANLSMGVVNDQLLSFADDRSGNILSELLLQQDLTDKVTEPAFYFNKKEKKADKALDYLLMTSGWRRFTWEKLLDQELPPVNYLGQKTIVSGTVLDAVTGRPIKNVLVKYGNGLQYHADENGKFSFKMLDLSEAVNLSFEAENYTPQTRVVNDYVSGLQVHLYASNYFGHNTGVPMTQPGMVMQIQLTPAMNAVGAGMPQMQVFKAVPMAKASRKNAKKAMAEKVMADVEMSQENEASPIEEDRNVMQKEEAKVLNHVLVEDMRFASRAADSDKVVVAAGNVYYRARQFSAPLYDKQEAVETRTDFRNTIYWNSNVEVGYSGKKTIEFYTSDDVTSFRTTIEGVGNDGSVGRVEENFFTQLPFAMSVKIPVEVATEDLLSIPLILKNNTNGPLGGELTISAPDGLKELQKIPNVQTIMPGQAKTIYLDYKVLDKIGVGEFTIGFKACGLGDAFTQKIKIASKGFPSQVSFSSQEAEKEYSFEISSLVGGSLKASFTAFPNVVSDLMKGVEGILQEPYGCFEQTSCSAYPNAMVLDYLKTTENNDSKLMARATDLLDRGYKRLTTFETPAKGYEWFGANPAHEGLTAYGIMEFVDMKKAGQKIDQHMLDRTAMWLLSHKNGKGGFEREQRALHDFGRISDEVLNGYIVYAMAEAGYTDIKQEFESAFNKAVETKDPYLLAMAANASFSRNENSKGKDALKLLCAKQNTDGSFKGAKHSITYSEGLSLDIETTALAIMAILKSPEVDGHVLNKAVQYLVSARSGSGVFSSTQGTILALKALTAYAKFSKKTTESGTIVIYVDHQKVAEQTYKAGDRSEIVVKDLEAFIKNEGKHTVKIKYLGVKNPLPYSVAINWNTSLPNSDKECRISISSKLSTKTALVGETVRLKTVIGNLSDKDVPSTMAILGIPAGFSAQPWQLKELQEKKVFDYYEIKGNNIAVYYRGLEAGSKKEINLDLKAEMPGEYAAPASSAYLYYTNEYKSWVATDKVIIKKM